MNPYTINSVGDYAREAEEFEARKRARVIEEQLAQGKLSMLPYQQQKAQLENEQLQKQMEAGISGNDPAAIREWKIYSQLDPAQQQRYLQMKRADQIMNLGGNVAVRSPMGGISETYPVTPRPEQMPAFQGEQEAAKKAASGMAETQNKARDDVASYNQTLPIVEQLKEWNKQSPQMAYSSIAQPIRRLIPGTSPEEAAVDLMQQARIELAAPLAKQLGVNPTDKDFQASLDRIFDLNATQESRANQIAALEKIISSKRLAAQKIANPTDYNLSGVADMSNVNDIKINTPAPPNRGEVVDGYMYNGGDPSSPTSWKKVR